MLPSAVAFTVRELLSLPVLANARLVAGERGIDRTVTRVNVMEVPDVAAWVRPGEFLVTTGYPYRNEPHRLSGLIPELSERGVSAFGIKPKRFLDEIPPEAIAEADRQGLPLIELPPETAFSDVVREVMERVLMQESAHLVVLQDRIQTITQLLLEGKDLLYFLDTIEKIMDNPVILVYQNHKIWVSKSLRGENEDKYLKYFSWIEQKGNSGFIQLENGGRAYAAKFIVRHRQAFLLLIERNREIAPLDIVSVDRLAYLAGLELINVEAVHEVESKYVDQFLQDWLSGKIASEDDFRLRADVCGCGVADVSLRAGILEWKSRPPAAQLREMARQIRAEWSLKQEKILSTVLHGDLTLIIPERPASASGFRWKQFLDFIRVKFKIPDARLFLGSKADRPERLAVSLTQARRARQAAHVCGLRQDVICYERLGAYALLYLIPKEDEWIQFLKRYIEPVKEFDERNGTCLIATLNAYFQCNGNVKRTAKSLFVHYNTVSYRLEQIERLLNIRLDDAEERFQLQLALKLMQMDC